MPLKVRIYDPCRVRINIWQQFKFLNASPVFVFTLRSDAETERVLSEFGRSHYIGRSLSRDRKAGEPERMLQRSVQRNLESRRMVRGKWCCARVGNSDKLFNREYMYIYINICTFYRGRVDLRIGKGYDRGVGEEENRVFRFSTSTYIVVVVVVVGLNCLRPYIVVVLHGERVLSLRICATCVKKLMRSINSLDRFRRTKCSKTMVWGRGYCHASRFSIWKICK